MLQSVCWSGYVRWRVNSRSVHSVGVGDRFIVPVSHRITTNYCAPVRKYTLDKTK